MISNRSTTTSACRPWSSAISRWNEQSRTSRRGFLIGAGALAGGAVLAACSSGSSSSDHHRASGAATTSAKLTGDLAVAALAASLENLAVAAYGDVLTAATAGKLGTVPPAVANFATTVKGQHTQHAQAWNSAIVAAGHKAITKPDPVLVPVVTKDFAKVTDVTGAAKLALMLEDIAAATYQSAVTRGEGDVVHQGGGEHPTGRDAARRHPQLRPRPVSGAERLQPAGPRPSPDRLHQWLELSWKRGGSSPLWRYV